MAKKMKGQKMSLNELKKVNGGIKGIGFFCYGDYVLDTDPEIWKPCPTCKKSQLTESSIAFFILGASMRVRCSVCKTMLPGETTGFGFRRF